ncbi:MAG: helix-turn-helix domain-containing protein [bacterium]
MNEVIDEFLTIDELAKILKVTKVTLYRMARKGKIPAMKFGKAWRISSRLLEDMRAGRWTNE